MNDSNVIYFHQLLRDIWNRKWILILSVLVCIIFSIFYLNLVPRLYQADLLLRVENSSHDIGATLLGNQNMIFDEERGATDSQIKIIKSRAILGQTVDQFHLRYELRKPFSLTSLFRFRKDLQMDQIKFWLITPDEDNVKNNNLTLKISNNSKVLLYNNDQLILEGQKGDILSKNGYSLFFDSKNHLSEQEFEILVINKLSAIDKLRSHLTVSTIDQGRLLELRLLGDNPELIVSLLDSIANNYVKQNQEQEVEKLMQGIDFIQEELPLIHFRLEQAEQLLSNFQIENDTVDLGSEGEALIKASIQIEKELTDLQLKEKELRILYTNNHPLLQTIIQQQQTLKEYRKQTELRLETIPEASQSIIRLKRDVEVNQAIYLQLLTKLQELNIIKASSIKRIKIIDTATAANIPIKPKRNVVFILAFLIGMMFGIIYLLLTHRVKSRILVDEDIVNNTGIPIRGSLSLYKRIYKNNNNNLLTTIMKDYLVVEQIYRLRTNLKSLLDNENNIIIISHLQKGTKDSLISANIATSFSRIGLSVVLINLDFNNIQLNQYFQQNKQKYVLTDAWRKKEQNNFNYNKTQIKNLWYIPCGKFQGDSVNLISHKNFSNIMRYFSTKFDIVIVDAPDIFSDVTLALSTYKYNLLLTVILKITLVQKLKLAKNQFENIDSDISGIIVID